MAHLYFSSFQFIEFAMVTQHAETGWNRTYVPTDIIPFITHPAHEREFMVNSKTWQRPYFTLKVWRPKTKRRMQKLDLVTHQKIKKMFRGYQNGINSFTEPWLLGWPRIIWHTVMRSSLHHVRPRWCQLKLYLIPVTWWMFFEHNHTVKGVIFGNIRCCQTTFIFQTTPKIWKR